MEDQGWRNAMVEYSSVFESGDTVQGFQKWWEKYKRRCEGSITVEESGDPQVALNSRNGLNSPRAASTWVAFGQMMLSFPSLSFPILNFQDSEQVA